MDLKPYPSTFDMRFECCVLCFFCLFCSEIKVLKKMQVFYTHTHTHTHTQVSEVLEFQFQHQSFQ